MRVLRATLAIGAVTLAALSCAAVTGLGDYEIVACPDGCDGSPDALPPADGSQVVTLPDGGVVTVGSDAGDGDDDGGGDAGGQPLDGAIPITPDCTVSACPAPLGAVCSAEPCVTAP